MKYDTYQNFTYHKIWNNAHQPSTKLRKIRNFLNSAYWLKFNIYRQNFWTKSHWLFSSEVNCCLSLILKMSFSTLVYNEFSNRLCILQKLRPLLWDHWRLCIPSDILRTLCDSVRRNCRCMTNGRNGSKTSMYTRTSRWHSVPRDISCTHLAAHCLLSDFHEHATTKHTSLQSYFLSNNNFQVN